MFQSLASPNGLHSEITLTSCRKSFLSLFLRAHKHSARLLYPPSAESEIVFMRMSVCVCGTRKLFLYSVHDTTLMPCLMALGVFDMRWPPYAADITLELYQNRHDMQHYVKISYIGQVKHALWHSTGPQWCNAFLIISKCLLLCLEGSENPRV